MKHNSESLQKQSSSVRWFPWKSKAPYLWNLSAQIQIHKWTTKRDHFKDKAPLLVKPPPWNSFIWRIKSLSLSHISGQIQIHKWTTKWDHPADWLRTIIHIFKADRSISLRAKKCLMVWSSGLDFNEMKKNSFGLIWGPGAKKQFLPFPEARRCASEGG